MCSDRRALRDECRDSFGSDPMGPGVNRLVIRAPNWLGDAVMALPAMGAVRAAFAEAHLAVAAIPSIAPLFEERTSAGQDSVIVLPEGTAEASALRAGGVRRDPPAAEFVSFGVVGSARVDT